LSHTGKHFGLVLPDWRGVAQKDRWTNDLQVDFGEDLADTFWESANGRLWGRTGEFHSEPQSVIRCTDFSYWPLFPVRRSAAMWRLWRRTRRSAANGQHCRACPGADLHRACRCVRRLAFRFHGGIFDCTFGGSVMARGTVKWFNSQKGYGFIQPQSGGGKDVFVHISAVEKAGLSSLNEGQIVEYDEVPNKGKTSAENLKVQR